ncbi:MAG: single-strand binding protein [Acidimicrobiaceae bacterium]|nr:single-strand binding protein [Acidimicrobiaceae bacterium]
MSETTIVGNIGQDPELRFTQSGKAICTLSVAVNRKKGEEYVSHWFDVTCWNELAENVAESLTKGMRVLVSGRLEQQTWEDKNGGGKRSKVIIIADEIAPSLRWATASVTKTEQEQQQ